MENDETRHCFRCKGLAVINKRSLERLPAVLNDAAAEMTWLYSAAEGANKEQVMKIVDKLREYAIMIEGMPNGD